ncbi:MAG: thioredoxin [Bacteroidales bacterium]
MIEHLNEETFREKVFDYTQSQDFKYIGKLPALIDFYAEWCGPCKMITPILEELAKEYEGKVAIYKIDTDKEEKLAYMFGIRSIPSLLFVPMDGGPMMEHGAKTKKQMEEYFHKILGVNPPAEPKEIGKE